MKKKRRLGLVGAMALAPLSSSVSASLTRHVQASRPRPGRLQPNPAPPRPGRVTKRAQVRIRMVLESNVIPGAQSRVYPEAFPRRIPRVLETMRFSWSCGYDIPATWRCSRCVSPLRSHQQPSHPSPNHISVHHLMLSTDSRLVCPRDRSLLPKTNSTRNATRTRRKPQELLLSTRFGGFARAFPSYSTQSVVLLQDAPAAH